MRDDIIEKQKADTKKAMSDKGNKMAYAKADENADVELIKDSLKHNEAEKKIAQANDEAEKKIAYTKVGAENEKSEKRK